MQPVNIESLDQEGRGIAHADGKTIFILGALPGERVTYVPFEKKPRYEIAQVEHIVTAAAVRTVPHCRHFGVCGGCSMQHLDYRAQVATKQRVLEDALAHVGKVQPGSILPAIYGQPWGYRHRARFSARYVPKKGGALVGFREKRSSHVTNMTTCEVIPPRISALLGPLRSLINGLSIPTRMPQVELAIGESADVLVFRILDPLDTGDEALFREFAAGHGVRIFLQPRGPDSAVPLEPADDTLLSYTLPEFALDLAFSPTEFTQVNPAVNAVLVRRALAMLEPQPGERIADLFCGLGNFSLAIARSGASVVGLEGTRGLIGRALYNAERNGLSQSAEFVQADLFKLNGTTLARLRGFDRMLVDPPRDGAIEVVKALDADSPRRIVYVSCNPATLARDAGVLVHTKGYGLTAAGVINMFPHTSHVESIAVFDRAA